MRVFLDVGIIVRLPTVAAQDIDIDIDIEGLLYNTIDGLLRVLQSPRHHGVTLSRPQVDKCNPGKTGDACVNTIY